MERILRTILFLIVGIIVAVLGIIFIVPLIIYFVLFGKKKIKFGRPAQAATPENNPGDPIRSPHANQEYDIDTSCTVIDEEPAINNARIGSDNESN